MKLTCAKHPNQDGRHPIKLNGVMIGSVWTEKDGPKRGMWQWATLAIAVDRNDRGTCETMEEALDAVKASEPMLIER